ncbi:unnamed protein product [marine sediment metagenome]|uniref:Uncharacterized protein n=1 Tax=marine sediment metagenome TaxID=412755 RepID=X1IAM6_9ZZZZ
MPSQFYAGKLEITFDGELYSKEKLKYYIKSKLSAGYSLKDLREYYAREIELGLIKIERRKV